MHERIEKYPWIYKLGLAIESWKIPWLQSLSCSNQNILKEKDITNLEQRIIDKCMFRENRC